MEKHVALTFPTPIGRFEIPESAAVNRELQRVILEKEQSTPSQAYSNAGGWHSNPDFFDWPQPEIQTLRGWMVEAVQHMVGATLELMRGSGIRTDNKGNLRFQAWANICRSGDYHRIHNHPRSAWSGVYYVAAGQDAPGHPLSGQLELLDPRPFTEMVPTPGNPYGQKLLLKPESGTMVLFPGWLYHFVNPYLGAGERISVAFNALSM